MRHQAPSIRQPSKRSIWAILIGAVGLCLALAIPVVAEISTNAEITWGVYGLDTDTETDRIATQVMAIEQIGDTVYVGGKFLEARPTANGAPVAQPYLAAFHASTGELISAFRPELESAVYALQASPDGSRLFVGGEFRSINGDNEAHGLAALDPVTGAVDTTWRSKVANASGARPMVLSLTTHGSHLYASGRFERVGGGSRPLHLTDKVTRVSLVDGTADPTLTTDIDGGSVWGVAVAPDGSKIYLAGYHDAVDGNPAGADYAVLESDGNLIPSWSDKGGNSSNPDRRYGQDIVAVGDLIFWGGSEHIVRVYSAVDGSLVREHTTDRGGDYQDLEVVGDRVYGSCHCYTNHYADFDWWTRGAVLPDDVVVSPIRYVAAYSAITGEYIPTFFLDASATKAGVWAIHGASDGCLWVGGDISRYTTVAGNDRAAGGFARFCEGDGGDSQAPETPPNLVQTRSEKHKIVIRWDRSGDNLEVTHYEVARDGTVVGTVAGGGSAQYWFTDTGLDEAMIYAYEVTAVDAAGNRSAPAALEAVTVGAAVGSDTEAPTEPGALTQTRAEDHKIVIRWDASTDNTGVVAYEVTRDGTVIGTKTASTATRYWFTDTGLDAGTAYTYEVVALDDAGNRSTPAALTAATNGAPSEDPPPAPTGLRSTLQTRDRIVLNWVASDGAVSYLIQRDEGAGFVEVGARSGVWFTDLTVSPGTTYTYRVVAVDGAGQHSMPSTEVVIATLP